MRPQKIKSGSLLIFSLLIGFTFIFSSLIVPPQLLTSTGDKVTAPKSSATNTVMEFKINGTNLYEEGTYYFYRTETLNLWVNASTDVQEAYFYYQHTTNPSVNDNQTMNKAGTIFTLSYNFLGTQLVGKYDAVITLYNGTDFTNYTFFLDISDPEPVIYAVYVRDTRWNNQWVRIYDGQTIETYRSTTLELITTVGNPDGLSNLNSVTLGWEEGFTDNWTSAAMTAGATGTYNGHVVRNYTSTSLNTNFDGTVNNRERWKQGNQFKANITALDNDNHYWIFEFQIKIKNRPPKITMFDVSPYDIPSPTGNGTIVTIKVNASDLEDDVVYDASSHDIINKYRTSQNFGINNDTGNISWVDEDSHPFTGLMEPGDYVYLRMHIKSGGIFRINTSMGAINPEVITAWQIRYTYSANTSTDIKLEIYNYDTASWDLIESLDGDDTHQWVSHITPMGVSSLSHYCKQFNGYKIQVRYREATSSVMRTFYMDSFNITYTADIRVSTPSISLYVYDPLANTPQIFDIMQFWNYHGSGNYWTYEYNISTSHNYRGAWTFAVHVNDYGYAPYIPANELGNYNFEIYSQAYAEASFLVNWGVPRSSINNITGSGLVINETKDPDPGKDLNLKLTVSDDTNGDFRYVTLNDSIKTDHLYFQNGNPNGGIPTNSSAYSEVQPSQYKNGTRSIPWIIDNDNKSCIVDLNPGADTVQDNQSIIFEHFLDEYYWLNKENISGIKFHINWFFENDPSLTVTECGVTFYNWVTKNWTNTVHGTGGDWFETAGPNQLCPSPPTQNDSAIYDSTWLNDTNLINQIVDETHNNRVLVRVFIVSNGADTYDLNACINFERLEISYKNYFSAVAKIADKDGVLHYFNMTNTVDGSGYRIWELNFSASDFIAQEFLIYFDIQNGNSSSKIWGYRVQTIKVSENNYHWSSFVARDEEHWWDGNYTISVKRRPLSSSFTQGVPQIYRINYHFMCNGTIQDPDGYGLLHEDNYSAFFIQFRLGGAQEQKNWPISVSILGNNLNYSDTMGFWNLDYAFGSYISAGRYFYRLYIQSKEGITYASDWYDLRILNYQPKNFAINSFSPSGSYYREVTPLSFDIQIYDLESNESGLYPSFMMNCLDRTGQDYTWIRNASTSQITGVGGNNYRISGNFVFGREINIGSYDNIYIRVSDNDPVWPETGRLRISNVNITILDNAPFISMALDSVSANDSVYRNNSMTLYWNISDFDDWDWQNFTLSSFRIDYPNGTFENIGAGSVIYNVTSKRFEYHRFYNIYESIGTFAFTIDYTDPDGEHLVSVMHYNLNVLDNLPILKELMFINLNETVNGTHPHATLYTSNNLTDFMLFRGYQTLKILVNLSDIEDTYKPEKSYHINTVYFTLTHNKTSLYDPWPNKYASWDNFTLKSVDTANHIETWELSLTLPTSKYFYAGGCFFNVYMKDTDNGIGINNQGFIGIKNNPPRFFGDIFRIWVNNTLNPDFIGKGTPIYIDIFATDDDIGELGIESIRVDYQVESTTRTYYLHSTFGPNDWDYNSTDGRYIVIIQTDSQKNPNMPTNVVSIKITGITVQDNDAGHIDDLDKYGITSAQYTVKNPKEMFFYEVERTPFPIQYIIIPVGIVAAVVFSVWYYRKYFSYRKYMD